MIYWHLGDQYTIIKNKIWNYTRKNRFTEKISR